MFLALNNPEFCNKHIRSYGAWQICATRGPGGGAWERGVCLQGGEPGTSISPPNTTSTSHPTLPPHTGFFPGDPAQGIVSLGGYVTFWGWFFTAVTIALALFKSEGRDAAAAASMGGPGSAGWRRDADGATDDDGTCEAGTPRAGAYDGGKTKAKAAGPPSQWRDVVAAYKQLWGVVKLPAIWALSALLVTYRCVRVCDQIVMALGGWWGWCGLFEFVAAASALGSVCAVVHF